eukprot:scaffold2334_cov138-Skeletonema_menzelii.AAC.15
MEITRESLQAQINRSWSFFTAAYVAATMLVVVVVVEIDDEHIKCNIPMHHRVLISHAIETAKIQT